MDDHVPTDLHSFVARLNKDELQKLEQILAAKPLCPSLQILENQLAERALSGYDLPLAQLCCLEFAQSFALICPSMNTFSRTEGLMDRIDIFDGKNLEVRAHLFFFEVFETFVHDHQRHFISCCIQGTYNHVLHSVIPKEGAKHFTLTRKSGGIYSEEWTETDGEPVETLEQPFTAGQCLFLSAHAYHTVKPKKGPVITITFRDKKAIRDHCTILTQSQQEIQLAKSDPIVDPQTQKELIEKLETGLQAFATNILVNLPEMVEAVKDTREMTKYIKKNLTAETRKHLRDVVTLAAQMNFYRIGLEKGCLHDVVNVKFMEYHIRSLVTRLCGHPGPPEIYSSYRNMSDFVTISLPWEDRKALSHCLVALGKFRWEHFDQNIQDLLEELFQFPRFVQAKDDNDDKQQVERILDWAFKFVNER